MERYTGGSEKCVFNEIVAVPLTKENCQAWFKWVKNYLIARDLWRVTNGKSAKPAKNRVRDYAIWERKNAAALHAIQISCSPESFAHIKRVSEAKVAWKTLNRIYNSPMPQLRPYPNVQVDFDVWALRKAIWDNNWDIVKAILYEHPNAAVARLDSQGQTSFHLAATFGQVDMVEELVRSVSPDLLEIVDNFGATPLMKAAYLGNVRIAECMVNKNSRLPTLFDQLGELPVTRAISRGHKAMGRYLYFVTPLDLLKPHSGSHGVDLLYWCFFAGAFDVVLDLLGRCQELLFTRRRNGWTVYQGIATRASAFSGASELVFWKRCVYQYISIRSTTTTCCVRVDIDEEQNESNRSVTGLLHRLISHTYNFLGMKEIHELKLEHVQATQILSLLCENVISLDNNMNKEKMVKNALLCAAIEGNVEFVVRISEAFPQSITYRSTDLWNIFFFAVKHRQAKIFNLIHGLRFKDTLATQIDTFGNSMLHVAGQLAPSSQLNRISGPALQMQRELQWFKEVENVVPRGFKELKNTDGMQPEDVFKDSHKELRKEGEKWMKVTASSCSVVGALIITIMFAAAFTIPGGNNQNSGYPIFLKEHLFVVFIISDALSLFSSSTSVLIFLGILTSRYAEEDFLKSLPTKLIIGLFTLFLSIVTMMVAFSSCILLMLRHEYSWSFLPVIIVASVPVTLFVFLQFPLLIQMVYSTYGQGNFNSNSKLWL